MCFITIATCSDNPPPRPLRRNPSATMMQCRALFFSMGKIIVFVVIIIVRFFALFTNTFESHFSSRQKRNSSLSPRGFNPSRRPPPGVCKQKNFCLLECKSSRGNEPLLIIENDGMDQSLTHFIVA